MAPPASKSHWVFGYGSLMWRPGFDFLDRVEAVHQGRRRAFCIYSVHHRGTPARPGLVLGLIPGGAVRARHTRSRRRRGPRSMPICSNANSRRKRILKEQFAFEGAADWTSTPQRFFPIETTRSGPATCHLKPKADLIAGAVGQSGRNVDYLIDLVTHLRECGIADASMERLLRMVEARERLTPGGTALLREETT